MSEHQDSDIISAPTQEIVNLNHEPEKSEIELTPREQPSTSQVQHQSRSPEKKSKIQESQKDDRTEANKIIQEAVSDVESEEVHQPYKSQNQAQHMPHQNESVQQEYMMQQNVQKFQPIPHHQQQVPMINQYNHQNIQQDNSPQYISSKVRNRIEQFKQMPLHRAPWNHRFFVQTVLNNAKSYTFFKEYFDKPPKQKMITVIKPEKPDIPIEEFYRSSSLSQLLFDSAGKGRGMSIKKKELFRQSQESQGGDRRPGTQGSMRKSQSVKSLARVDSSNNLMAQEFNWDQKFNVMQSKNNVQVHTNYQEYFDRPLEYDVKGYAYIAKPPPMIVYDPQTPIVNELNFVKRFGTTTQFYRGLKSSGSQKRMAMTSSTQFRGSQNGLPFKNQRSQKNLPRFQSTASTKLSQGIEPSNKMKLMTSGWSDRIGLPISKYNETVYPRYKIMFEHL